MCAHNCICDNVASWLFDANVKQPEKAEKASSWSSVLESDEGSPQVKAEPTQRLAHCHRGGSVKVSVLMTTRTDWNIWSFKPPPPDKLLRLQAQRQPAESGLVAARRHCSSATGPPAAETHTNTTTHLTYLQLVGSSSRVWPTGGDTCCPAVGDPPS